MYLWRQVLYYLLHDMLIKKIKTYISQLPLYGQFFISGVLLGLPFVFPWTWPSVLVGIVFFIHLLSNSSSLKIAVIGGGIAWTTKAAVVLLWLMSVFPIDWVAIESPTVQLAILIFYIFTLAVSMGCGGVVFAGVFYLCKWQKWKNITHLLVTIPVLWVSAELIGAYSFSVFTWGPNIVPSPNFSFGFVGLVLAHVPVLQTFAFYGGVFALTYLLVMSALLIKSLMRQSGNKIQAGLVVGVLLLLGGYSFSSVKQQGMSTTGEKVTIAAIDTRYSAALLGTPQGQRLKKEGILEVVKEAQEFPVDYILLPEDSRYLQYATGGFRDTTALYPKYLFLNGAPTAVIIDSSRHVLADRSVVLRSFVIDGLSNRIHQFDKQYLVPQGEFMPIVYGTLFTLLGYGEVVEQQKQRSSYESGPALQTIHTKPSHIPSILFCSEGIAPTALAKLPAASFVVHPISHAWFHESKILTQQLDAMLITQAMWQSVPVVSAGNMATGKVYLPNGEITFGTAVQKTEYWNIVLIELLL